MKKKFCSLLIFFFTSIIIVAQPNLYKEKYRPQFHFSPAKNWTNDPNGLVYFDGEYHLFYQYNPYGNKWGHMSWGHAVSTDLIRWRHLPLAIPEKDSIMIFSGSAVVDKNNSSGFAKKQNQIPMVAVYTAHISDSSKPDNYRQEQHIAYSLDKGRSWTKYSGNPVLDLHKKDFRDPKVFWYDRDKKWIMAVVLPHEHIVQFYSSNNLKEWIYLSDFGPEGDATNIWECPDLLQVPVENNRGKKWVLLNSQQTTMQYFVGEFDGTKFINENPADKIFRPDYGPDYYAAITYNNLPVNQQPVFLGWANNWSYANDIPTFPWKSAMALPRNLSLKKNNNEWILIQQPVIALKSLRTNAIELKNINVVAKKDLPVKSQQLEIELILQPAQNVISGVRLAVGKQNVFIVGYNASSGKLFIDRSGCTNNTFNKNFADLSRYEASLTPINEKIKLHIFFDHSIVEVFANDGAVVMTAQLFPDEKDNGIELFSNGGVTKFESVKLWNMKSAWRQQ
jgi:fructan beta-fructosidase